MFEYLVEKMCALCYDRAWYAKYGGWVFDVVTTPSAVDKKVLLKHSKSVIKIVYVIYSKISLNSVTEQQSFTALGAEIIMQIWSSVTPTKIIKRRFLVLPMKVAPKQPVCPQAQWECLSSLWNNRTPFLKKYAAGNADRVMF